MRRALAMLCAGALLACGGSAPAPPSPDAASARSLPAGPVIGFASPAGAHVWKGLPFAEPPVGALRWRAPRPAARWSTPREALEGGKPCVQLASPLGGVADAPAGTLVGDEDCLTLDVYAPPFAPGDVPRGADRLPVMVWIHGGGNTVGTARIYDGSRLAAEQGVVVVALQYRLGGFGFFRQAALAAGGDADDASGNFGLLDQIRALEWVRDNIAGFGGDPGRVTIFGESAGGQDVLALLVSPRARGLFQRAISESGGTWSSSVAEAENRTDAPEPGRANSSAEVVLRMLVAAGEAPDRDAARARAEALGPERLAEWLRARPATAVLAGYQRTARGGIDLPRVFREGRVVPREGVADAVEAGAAAAVPVMIGTNRDEEKLFLFVNPQLVRRWFGVLPQVRDRDAYLRRARWESRAWKATGADLIAEPLARQRPGQVFGYRFDWDEEPTLLFADLGELLGASHGFEIPFVFGHWDLGREGRVLFSDDNLDGREALSAAMRGYWAAFAASGAPGGGGAGTSPAWQPWDASAPDAPRYLVLDTPAGGGIRMDSELVTLDAVAAEIAEDPGYAGLAARCEALAALVDRSNQRLGPDDYPRLASGLCADVPEAGPSLAND